MEKESGRVGRELKVTSMKEIILMIRNMVSVSLLGLVGTFIKESTKKMKEMDMVKWYGLMEVDTKEIGAEEFNMDKEKWYSLMDKSKKVSLNSMYSKATKKYYKIHRLKIWDQQKQVQTFMVHIQIKIMFLMLKIHPLITVCLI